MQLYKCIHAPSSIFSYYYWKSECMYLMLKLFEFCRVTIQSNNEWTSFNRRH